MIEVIKTEIPDVLIIKPSIFQDYRGLFWETYNKELFEQYGIHTEFKQDNQSVSRKDVLRGLHFQRAPFEQGKLIRVVSGSVLDVAVDIRPDSSSFGKHIFVNISSDNNLMLWIPSGFAHGFLALEENTILTYKCTNIYKKEFETSILWNDPELGINWGITHPIISEKDMNAYSFRSYITNYL
jgi:dTDP-4-dehydrorhamnose 3,5-epimerase